MLVLSRKKNESIFIGDDIIVTVIEIRGLKVRLRIAAPLDIEVHRMEVYEALHPPGGQTSQEGESESTFGAVAQSSTASTRSNAVGGLVLSRHRDESIIIAGVIVITVVDVRGDKVRLGIAAPIEISVHRQEVYEAIKRENRQRRRAEGE